MPLITDTDRKLMNEIEKDPVATKLLKWKCNWEHMTRWSVVREWGDPRTWPTYEEEKEEEKKKV